MGYVPVELVTVAVVDATGNTSITVASSELTKPVYVIEKVGFADP